MKLKSLKCNFLNFTSAPIVDANEIAGIYGLSTESDSTVEGMVDVSLTQS